MSLQTGSVDADGLARTTDGKLYVTLGSGSTIDSPTFTGVVHNGSIILGQSFAAVSCGADVTEDTLATISVPANSMGANGCLRISTSWTWTNNANNKTAKIHFGGAAGTAYLQTTQTTSNGLAIVTYVFNKNATNSQMGFQDASNTNGIGLVTGPPTSAVDTTAATTIVITGQKGSAGDTLTLNGYIAELLRT